MFAKRLIALRNREKLTQKELAAKLNLGRGALSLYEIGRREPDLQTLQNMADYFQVSIDYLLGRSESVNAKEKLGLDPLYLEIIEDWEKKKRTPAEMKEVLKTYSRYIRLISQWQKEGMTPEKVKEVWDKLNEMRSIL